MSLKLQSAIGDMKTALEELAWINFEDDYTIDELVGKPGAYILGFEGDVSYTLNPPVNSQDSSARIAIAVNLTPENFPDPKNLRDVTGELASFVDDVVGKLEEKSADDSFLTNATMFVSDFIGDFDFEREMALLGLTITIEGFGSSL